MSRPCFALSVMLSFLAFSLVAVEKTQGTDNVVSPNHGPSECILCPLAHGDSYECAEAPCGDYSDYDYNDYRLADDPAPIPPLAENAVPPLAEYEYAVPPPTEGAESTEDLDDDYYLSEYDWYGEDIAGDSVDATEAGSAPEEAATAEAELASDVDDLFDEAFGNVTRDGEANATSPDDLENAVSEEASTEDDSSNPTPAREYDDFEYYSGYESYEDFAEAETSSADAIQAEAAEPISVDPAPISVAEVADGETEWTECERDCYAGYESYEAFMEAGVVGKIGCFAGYSSYEAFLAAGDAAGAESDEDPADDTGETVGQGDKKGYYAGYDSYQAYMDAGGANRVGCYDGYPSYDAFMRAAIDEAPAAIDEVGAVSEWAGDDYGYYEDYESFVEQYEFDAPAAADSTEDVEPKADELLQTGYDHAYDNAMNPTANDEQTASEEVSAADSKAIYDEYESFYDAYDELYNFEPAEAAGAESARPLGPVIAEFEAAGAISLEEFAAKIIRSVMQDLELEMPQEAGSRPTWDCEEGVSTEAKTGPSVVHSTVHGLESAAVALHKVADDLLRRIATGSERLIGRAADGQVAR